MPRVATRKRTKSKISRSRKPKPETQEGTSAPPRQVAVLGSGERAEKVLQTVRRIGLPARRFENPDEVFEAAPEGMRLVLAVPPIADLSAADFCARFRRRSASEVPVLVVGSPPRHAERLYAAGAAGQFEWPDERVALIRATIRIAGVGATASRRTARDAALASKLEELLHEERATFGPLVKIQVYQGVVVTGGEVDSLWKVRELEKMLSPIPGVQEVVTDPLRVPVSETPDRVIASSLRSVLRSAEGVDHSTYAVKVAAGRVVLAGTAADHRELRRVKRLLENVKGVRSVESLVVVGRAPKGEDRRLAKRLSKLVATQFPRSRVDVTVFGKVAVLSGKTAAAHERRAIEALASDHPRIERVISKIA